MTEKAPDLCPHCGGKDTSDRKHKVYYHHGNPRCAVHGCVLRAGEWEFVCSKCHAREQDKLYGFLLDVPIWCKTCYAAAVEEEKQAGHICGICGAVQKNCCC